MTDQYQIPPGVSVVDVALVGGGGSGGSAGGSRASVATQPYHDAFNSWRLLRILRSRLRISGAWDAIAPDLRNAINAALDGEEQPTTKEVL